MSDSIIREMTSEFDVYLRDESRTIGKADTISFTQNEEEIIEVMRLLHKGNIKVTVQGARTGITAGAVPNEGHILNLEKMNRITGLMSYGNDAFILCMQPGVLLADIQKVLYRKEFNTSGWTSQSLEALKVMKEASTYFFFPPDPTEATASIGGMVACNASGARSFHYGPTRNYIEGLNVILADGDKIHIRRGMFRARGYSFSLTTDSGRIIKGKIPQYHIPDVKNASGYYAVKDMDLIDLFIGSEGTLGIISEIEIKLLKKPESTLGGMFFFRKKIYAINFVKALRDESFLTPPPSMTIRPVAIEYFNSSALKLLKTQKEDNRTFSNIPYIKEEFNTAIYVEFDENSEDDAVNSIIEAATRAACCGGSEEDSWVASTPQLMECMKLFRHSVPEAVNLLIDQRRRENPSLTKLGTDMAVPNEKLDDVLEMYETGLAENGFEAVMFGHIGNNHIHVNILPRDMDEYNRGKELYTRWACKVLEAGGTVSAEHGIGKLKGDFLEIMFKLEGIHQMMAVRKAFDPDNILNVGNLFDN